MEQVSQCIRKLHSKRQNVNDGEEVPAPIVEVQSMEESTTDSSCNKAQSTVNVRMLDGDNFETHWGALVPPLPGPPDHELRSPIVAAELQAWTNDSVLHRSLFAWMESI